MAIWTVTPNRQSLGFEHRSTMVDHLGITIDDVGDDYLAGSMPVDHRTIQIMGLLHGGASVVLAETLGSLASNLCVEPETQAAVGIQINANHVRAVRTGRVRGTARPIHLGRSTHVWQITLTNEQGRTVCVSTLTTAIIDRSTMGV